MDLREMDAKLRELWRAQHTDGPEAQERYIMGLQRKLKHAYLLVVHTNTWYGRGTPPLLSQQFDKVQAAWGLINEYGRLPFRLGIDEDAFFTANAHPDLPLMVINAYRNDQDTIELGGYEFHIDPDNNDDSEFYLTSYDEDGHDIRLVIKSELENPKPTDYAVKRLARIMTSTDAVTKDPITTWWENYGVFSNCPIDASAREVIERLNLDVSEHSGGVIEDLEIEDNLEESLESRLDSALHEGNTSPEMSSYTQLLMKYLNAVYPDTYIINKKGKDHYKVINIKKGPDYGKSVSISKSPTSIKVADRSIPSDFRSEFGIEVPSYPKDRRIFLNSELAHEYAGVPYVGHQKKRRVNPKLVKAQEMQELQDMPKIIGSCEQRIEEIQNELAFLYSTSSSSNREAAIPLATEIEEERKKLEHLESRYLELMEKYD